MKRFVLAAAILAIPSTLLADEVHLKSGGKLEGRVRKEADRVIVETLSGEFTVKLDDIASINEAHTSKIEEYYEKRKAAKAAKDFLDLAVWAKENRAAKFLAPNIEEAAKLARDLKDAAAVVDLASPYRGILGADLKAVWERAVALDPENETARRELGFRRYAGKWLTEEEWQAEQGNVKFEGKWIPETERDLILRERLAKLEQRIKDLEAREAKLAASQEKNDLQTRVNEENAKKLEADKKEYEKLKKELDDRQRKIAAKEKILGDQTFCSGCAGYYPTNTNHLCPKTWTQYCPTCQGWFQGGHTHKK
jgi:hypothetical protein